MEYAVLDASRRGVLLEVGIEPLQELLEIHAAAACRSQVELEIAGALSIIIPELFISCA